VVRLISEVGHGLQHSGPDALAHPAAAVEHVGDGLPAYPRGTGHILNCYLTFGGRPGLA